MTEPAKASKKHHYGPYHFVVTFPDRMYPFSSYVDGQKVRWTRSYDQKLADIQEKLGVGRYGLKLAAYREFFHIIGAGIVILSATLISKELWGSDAAIPVLFIVAMLVITYQEFVIQPRTYKQHLSKGIVDWFSWNLPLVLYFFLHF